MRRLTHLVVLVAFVFSCGGQWAAIQCLAWGNMIREYSQMVPLTQAVKMTFSGDYPCMICKALAEKKSADQQKALALGKYDKKFLALDDITVAVPAVAGYRYAAFAPIFLSRADVPPVPPPRSVLS
jgi:hypothetical protein